jgi:hypothetical protein
LSFGVFEQVVPDIYSYDSPLEFGLLTLLPEKVSGGRLEFSVLDDPEPKAQLSPDTGIKYTFWLHNGSLDRGESYQASSDSYDRAPAAQDSSMHMAFAAQFMMHNRQNAAFYAGYGDTQDDLGKRNSIFGVLTYRRLFTKNDWRIVTSVDSRILKERWDSSTSRHASLTQQTLSVTSLFNFGQSYDLAAGLHFGKSDRHLSNTTEIQTFEGWQIDLGMVDQLRENLDWSAYMSMENRTTNHPNGSDGFTLDSSSTSYLMRFAIQLRYTLDRS